MKINYKNLLVLCSIFFILLYLRRGDQLISPQVWSEDGLFNLTSFMLHGWSNLFEPVQGYLITVSKLITNISASISIVYYPEISTYLAWMFIIFVGLAIAFSPTKLRFPVLAALLVFLIPTDAENYGLPLYTFWFSSLLLFLVAMWQPGKAQGLKLSFLTLGGLSSPVIIVLIPVLIVRAYFEKELRKHELSVLFLSVLFSTFQIYFILSTKTSAFAPIIDIEFLQAIVIKFFGMYYLNGWGLGQFSYFFGGLAVIVLITYKVLKSKDVFLFILVFLLIASVLLSVTRVPLNIIDPYLAGPRYFFFPYILLSWVLLYVVDKSNFVIVIILLMLSVYSSFSGFGRTHDELNWRMNLSSCAMNDESFNLPIHTDGDISKARHITLTSEQCNSVINNDFFKMSSHDRNGLFIKNISAYHSIERTKKYIPVSNITNNTFGLNGIYGRAPLEGFEVFGSYISGDKDLARIQFLAVQGDSFLIKTSPITTHQKIKILDKCGNVFYSEILTNADEWQIFKLMKSNFIPENLIVEIEDNGTGWGEWSAVAFKKY